MGRTVKPTKKAKQRSSKKTPPTPLQTQETYALITQLIELLGQDWNESEATTEVNPDLADNSIPQDLEEDPIRILASRLHSNANALDQS